MTGDKVSEILFLSSFDAFIVWLGFAVILGWTLGSGFGTVTFSVNFLTGDFRWELSFDLVDSCFLGGKEFLNDPCFPSDSVPECLVFFDTDLPMDCALDFVMVDREFTADFTDLLVLACGEGLLREGLLLGEYVLPDLALCTGDLLWCLWYGDLGEDLLGDQCGDLCGDL